MNQDAIPSSLKQIDQWVLWKNELKSGKLTKLPKQTNEQMASSTDPTTWTTFNRALNAYRGGAGPFTGLGFVFTATDGLCGIDLDGCYDKAAGKCAPWAREWVLAFNSYTEISPSGTGVKIFVQATKPTWCGNKRAVEADPVDGDKKPGIEIYDRERYFAVTGKRLTGLPTEPQERQELVDQFCEAFFERPQFEIPRETREFSSLDAVLDRCRKYLATLPPAISESGGHNATFKAACRAVCGFGLDEAQGMTVMREWNQTHCQPPWSDKELLHKVRSALKAPGERNYLRDARPHQWSAIRIPDYAEPKPKKPRKFVTSVEATQAYIDRLAKGAEDCVGVGIPTLESAIGGGVQFGEMVVFAAPSNHCKSSFALQVVHYHSVMGNRSLVISSEMSHHLLGKRTLQTHLDLSQHDWKQNIHVLHNARDEYLNGRETWYIDDESHSIDEVLASIDEAVDKFGVKIVCLDYLQMIEATQTKSAQERVSKVSSLLRDKAKERNLLLVALAQMNRELFKRKPICPKSTDIQDSSRIFQDADVVLFGIWPHKIDETKAPELYDVYVAKNRNRETLKSVLQINWDAARQTFTSKRTVNKYDFD